MMSQPRPSARHFFAQLLRIALILVAETEIVPRDEVYGAVLLHQQLGDEVLPRHGHHRAVKRLDKHRADAVILTDDLRALRRACEQRHGNAGDKLLRRAVEGKGRGRDAQLAGALRRFPQQRAVAQMHPSKKPRAITVASLMVGFPQKKFLMACSSPSLRAGEREEVPRAVVNAVFPIRNAARGEGVAVVGAFFPASHSAR